jgi:hypothetical protein
VSHLRKHFGVSERRACRVVDQPRSSQRYVSTKANNDAALVERMVAISCENRLQMMFLMREDRRCLWCDKPLHPGMSSHARFCKNNGRCRVKWNYHSGGVRAARSSAGKADTSGSLCAAFLLLARQYHFTATTVRVGAFVPGVQNSGENQILKKSLASMRSQKRHTVIGQMREEHPEMPLEKLCSLMGVSRSWYYACPPATQKAKKDIELRDAIERTVLQFPGYGYRRVSAALRREGWTVKHKRVLGVMRQESLLCQLKRRFVPTTDSAHAFARDTRTSSRTRNSTAWTRFGSQTSPTSDYPPPSVIWRRS